MQYLQRHRSLPPPILCGRCARGGAELADKVLYVCVSASIGNALHGVRGGGKQFLRRLDARAGETFPVPTPSCWETYPGFGNYRGEGRYTTVFRGEGDLRVVCKGVSHTAQVFLDGVCIARHYNAYTLFSAVVRGVPAGEHTLAIVADNRFSEESALHVPNDYMSYGGVSRAVSVERLGSAYLRYLHVTPRFVGGKWHAHVRACAENLCEDAAMSVQVRIAGQTLSLGLAPAEGGLLTAEGDMSFDGVRPWSPASPALYTAEARLLRGLCGRVYLAVLGYPRERRMVGRQTAHHEQQRDFR